MSRRRAAGIGSGLAIAIVASALVGSVVLVRPAYAEPEVSRFATRTDLRPPLVKVGPGADPAGGLVFLTPAATYLEPPPPLAQTGPLIVDSAGEPVWFAPTGTAQFGDTTDQAADLKVQQYRGQDVLTWWRGDISVPPGAGAGEFVIVDDSYRQIATVRAVGIDTDLHEMVLTGAGTALLMGYPVVDTPSGEVIEGVVQEIDIATGDLLFEWRSLDDVPVGESLVPDTVDGDGSPFDYIHLNSIDIDAGGDLLISARHTSAVYKVDRDTGDLIWTMGGKASDFAMGDGADFAFQHDARRLPDGTISIFDNGQVADPAASSRAIVLDVDEADREVALVREHRQPQGLLAASQGSAQVLEDGNVFVGWGSLPTVTEFAPDGTVAFQATYGRGLNSYRAYRGHWVGRPTTRPEASVRSRGDGMTVLASWNGATEVATWRVLAGPNPSELSPVAEAARGGFETAVPVRASSPYVAVEALDAAGNVLGRSVAEAV